MSDQLFKIYPGMRAVFLNHFSYYRCKHLLKELKSCDIYADGLLFVYQLRFFSKDNMVPKKRYSFDFTSIAEEFLLHCKSNNIQMVFIGGTPVENASFIKIIKSRIGYTRVSGFNGYEEGIIDKIYTEHPNHSSTALILGLGSPLQEELLLKLSSTDYYCLITCGGFITQTANSNGDYYPIIYDQLNLRWLYRLVKTNYVLRRLIFIYPLSIFRFAFKGFN